MQVVPHGLGARESVIRIDAVDDVCGEEAPTVGQVGERANGEEVLGELVVPKTEDANVFEDLSLLNLDLHGAAEPTHDRSKDVSSRQLKARGHLVVRRISLGLSCHLPVIVIIGLGGREILASLNLIVNCVSRYEPSFLSMNCRTSLYSKSTPPSWT